MDEGQPNFVDLTNLYRIKEIKIEIITKLQEALDSFQELLFSNRLEDFEKELPKHFYRHSKSLLALDTCYIISKCYKVFDKNLNCYSNQFLSSLHFYPK